MKILFLTLKTFSAGGGIEKVCRLTGKAMLEYSKQPGENFTMYSMYDGKEITTEPYVPSSVFKGFEGRKWWFKIKSIQQGIKSGVVALSDISLLPAGYLIKLISPKTKVILIAQGIDVRKTLSLRKKRMLKRIDLIIPVSDFTKDKLKTFFDLPEEKFRVVANCLDPFLQAPADESRRNECRSIYGIGENDFVLMTLCYMSSKEKGKGYDKVLIAVKKLQSSFPQLKYLFVGNSDADEKVRLDNVIRDLGIEEDVIFTGFVPDSVLADFYNMSDAYIIPGEKESFGFPFINALYYNKPVIAGKSNDVADSRDGNSLGTLIDLRSQEEITGTIQKVITDIKAFMPDRKLVMKKFGYPVFKANWKAVLDEVKG